MTIQLPKIQVDEKIPADLLPNMSGVTVITPDGTSNELVVWMGYDGMEPADLPKYALKVSLGESPEVFQLVVDTRMTATNLTGTSTSFIIPAITEVPYNWRVDWGDGNTDVVSGVAGGEMNNPALAHTYTTAGRYTITIKPAGLPEPAWLAAYGFYIASPANESVANLAHRTSNRNKIVGSPSKLTPLMFGTVNSATGSLAIPTAIYTRGACGAMFSTCKGVEFTMMEGFGFHSDWDAIKACGDWFCREMFANCTGAAFTMNSTFNVPRITAPATHILRDMFNGCYGDGFMVNDVFTFPAHKHLYDQFNGTFSCVLAKTYVRQRRSIQSIIGANAVPTTDVSTFKTVDDTQGANRWSDWAEIAATWK